MASQVITGSALARWDLVVDELRAGLPNWQALPLTERITLLRSLRRRIGAEADGMAAAMSRAQGVGARGPWAAEELAVLVPMATAARALEHVLGMIAAGHEPLPPKAVHHRVDGRLAVDVFPVTWDDYLLLGDYRAQVWLPAGTTEDQVRRDAAASYRGRGFTDSGVALLLGAGNMVLLVLTDLLHLLFERGCVVAVKMNPVLAYLRPTLERIFGEFVEHNWVRFVDETPAVGGYLARHAGVDRVHMTGSAATFDALVWGTGGGIGTEAEARRAAGTPLLTKPITAELGGVSPIIVVPGDWTASDVRRQADVIASAKLCNCGHVCASPQVLVLPDGWPHGDALLTELRDVLRTAEPRLPYYPGTDAKVARAVAGRSDVEALLQPGRRLLVDGLEADGDPSLFRDEVFADVLGVVRLPADDVGAYLAGATRFANERLAGTLAATLLVDPDTQKAHAAALDAAVAGLRYGTVGINAWPAVSFFLGYPSWGAYPGHTLDAVGSGIGTVLNPYLLPDPEKSVITGTFRPRGTPPTSLRNRTALVTWRRLLGYWTTDEWRRLPGVLLSAMRG